MSRSSILCWLFCAAVTASAAQDLEMYWVDVEGGAATLIVTPAGESLLIDTGMPGTRDPHRIHKVATEIAGLERIDHLVTTHFHIDHFGGAADLAKLMPIGTVYDYGIPEHNPDNPEDPSWAARIRPYTEMKVERRVVLQPGSEIALKQAENSAPISLRCLMALQQTVPKPAEGTLENPLCADARTKEEDTSDNANSIALLLSFGDFQMFDGGDLTWNVEAKLACPFNLAGPVDIYDVNHHGLDSSNNPLLVRALAPTVAIMSNGTTKGCGPETIDTLHSVGSIQALYQIHRNLRPDGANTVDAQIANLTRDCAAHFIHVTVDSTGADYHVSIPGRDHRRTFRSR